MDCVLTHKYIPVCQLQLDEATGHIMKIGKTHHPEHLPVGVKTSDGAADRADLNRWWAGRTIPASRSGIGQALEAMGLADTRVLLTKCLGLSLSDQYWMKPMDRDVDWADVNFFDNPFSEDVGNALLGKPVKPADFDFHSPDNTSDGFLKKRWKIINEKRYLLKAGTNPFMQQPFNEVIASAVMRRLGIRHASYSLIFDHGVPYSACEDFITKDTELVSAWRVMRTQKRGNQMSLYHHYLNCCEALGAQGIARALDEMLVVDYIIANEDRHQNNFGLVRNAETLEWIGAAPIYDSGSSLGYDKLTSQILSEDKIECKPFRKTHEQQIKLVSSFDWVDFGALDGLGDEMRGILNAAGKYMDEDRKSAIIASVEKRIAKLKIIAETQ